jgi:transcriptional regulator with PAS, ATPase and Fis domain
MTLGDVIGLGDLLSSVRASLTTARSEKPEDSSTLSHLMRGVEARTILEAVEKYRSQRQAAHHLGINQSTISRKLRKLRYEKVPVGPNRRLDRWQPVRVQEFGRTPWHR